jgi:hypothetical protein
MANPTGKGGFKPRDPRINRKGRPKTFDKLRSLAQMIAVEDGITTDEAILSNVEVILRGMMKNDPKLFLEIAYGKVPNPIELSGKGGEVVKINVNIKDDDEKL